MRTSASLLARLRQEPEDGLAWAEFVERYGPLIYAWCRCWRLQTADAEDVTQNVLMKMATHLRSFQYDSTRRFRGLLKVITHNAWSDFLSGKQRAIVASGDSDVRQALESVEARDDLLARLEAAFDQELLGFATENVKSRVEPHTWEAFRLTAIEGKTGLEVAESLGMQIGTVFKARSKVQKMLREEIERLESEMSA
jgi:RNA polymerase sigma-70 factor (ECF subfamily)